MNSIFSSEIIGEYINKQKPQDFEVKFLDWAKQNKMEEYIGVPDHFAIKVISESDLQNLTEEFS